MSPFAFTMPFKKIVPKVMNTSCVSARTVFMSNYQLGPCSLSREPREQGRQSGDPFQLYLAHPMV
jgi:hypothetical protein